MTSRRQFCKRAVAGKELNRGHSKSLATDPSLFLYAVTRLVLGIAVCARTSFFPT
jgi:hypothetical protein